MTASAQDQKAGRPVGAFTTWPLWLLTGSAGSLLLTLAGSRLGGGSVTWWFDPRIGSDRPTERVFFYIGVVLLIVGWLGLRPWARSDRLTPRQIALIAAAWCLPLAIGAPLFSRDIYSYLAQGVMAHLGLSPYHAAPAVLARVGQTHVLSAVDPFWRGVTAPYGPLFVGVISLIVGATGSHLVAGALLVRAFDLIGLVLLAVFVPRLAHRAGADPSRASWLAVASPLVLLQLVAPAHNDLLMAGLMVAGVSLAVDERPLIGVAVCALAATVKLPAIVAVAFVALVWVRRETRWRGQLVRAGQAAGVAIAVLALVTLLTGFGLDWISSGLFSTPARVKLAITPATDISWTLAKLLAGIGVEVGFHFLHSALRAVIFAGSLILAAWLLLRSRRATLIAYLGLALVVFAIAGPALWPWYLSWGLVVLATWEPAQRSWAVAVALIVGSVLVKPGGILALPLGSSPILACLWLALLAVLWHHRRRRPRLNAREAKTDSLSPAHSVLVER